MKVWTFKVYITGTGDDIDTAWLDAVESFVNDQGTPPIPEEVEEVEE